ncbi:MAG: hypothetical protein VB118_05435 [Oscillospiraceae bacterium]|nr:hypothetical protein [Oscillospiraceae bacterium]
MSGKKSHGAQLTYKQTFTLVICCIVVLALLGTAAAALIKYKNDNGFWFWERFSAPENTGGPSVEYYEANYDENIFEDKDYMSLVRDIYYTTGGYTELLDKAGCESKGKDAVFFREFFDAIISGDADTYNTFFMKNYFETNEKDDSFTMQRIYDISVTVREDTETELNGAKIKCSNYIVSYKIMKNNGTFRLGIPSDTVKPQLYRLIEENGKLKIHSILEIKTIYE